MFFNMAELIQSLTPLICLGNLLILAKALWEIHKGDVNAVNTSISYFFLSMFASIAVVIISKLSLITHPGNNIFLHALFIMLDVAAIPGTMILRERLLRSVIKQKEQAQEYRQLLGYKWPSM